MFLFEVHKLTEKGVFDSRVQHMYSHFKYGKDSFFCADDLSFGITGIEELFNVPEYYVFFRI